jgi:hypothetical protein
LLAGTCRADVCRPTAPRTCAEVAVAP